jgi:hypothetical protein
MSASTISARGRGVQSLTGVGGQYPLQVAVSLTPTGGFGSSITPAVGSAGPLARHSLIASEQDGGRPR